MRLLLMVWLAACGGDTLERDTQLVREWFEGVNIHFVSPVCARDTKGVGLLCIAAAREYRCMVNHKEANCMEIARDISMGPDQ